MAKNKKPKVPEWAARITALRLRLRMSESQLAKRLECSARTVSLWERGVQPPTAKYYIQLARMAGGKDRWFFWERAGLRASDLVRALPSNRVDEPWNAAEGLKHAIAGPAAISNNVAEPLVSLPLSKTVAGSHGTQGDKKMSLDLLSATKLLGAPTEWCPNPGYISLLHVLGHSMEPLIRDGDILAVDSSQTDHSQLDGKIVVVTHEENGLCVSRLRHYERVDVLQSENPHYGEIVFSTDRGWQLLGKVLWWISPAP